MKTNLLIVVSLCLLFATFSFAQVPASQDTIVVEGGQANVGNLETVINGDTTATGQRVNPRRVYKLLKNTIYFQQSPIYFSDTTGTLTIVGEKGGKKPVIYQIKKGDQWPTWTRIIGSLTLKNLQFEWPGLAGASYGGWLISSDNQDLVLEDCLFDLNRYEMFNMDGVKKGLDVWVKNCYFRDITQCIDWWGSRALRAKVPVDTLWIENTTVTNSGLTFLFEGFRIRFFYFNHNTIINVKKYLINTPYYETAYVTNNLFVNHDMFGDDVNIYDGGDKNPDGSWTKRGVINVDTLETQNYPPGEPPLAMKDTKIFIADNIHWINRLLYHYYNGELNPPEYDFPYPVSKLEWSIPGIVPVENVPSMFLNTVTKNFIAAYPNIVSQDNYDNDTDPQLVTPSIASIDVVDSLAMFTNRLYGVSTEVEKGHPWLFGDESYLTIPGKDTENGDGIRDFTDLREDFSYTSDIRSKIDGRPIGALHWWPDEMASYNSQEDLNLVTTAYNDAVTSVKRVDAQVPSDYKLAQNYPNPFNPVTTIKFSLARKRQVNLTVFNSIGQKVATLISARMEAGSYKVTWDASNVPSGLYLYTMETDNQKLTRKMMLIK